MALLMGGFLAASMVAVFAANGGGGAGGGAREGRVRRRADGEGRLPAGGGGWREAYRESTNANEVPETPAAVYGVPVEVLDRAIVRVAAHEGGFDSLNLNRDGAGLSMGILQWSQRPRQLGVLLTTMATVDLTRFIAIFGERWQQLLKTSTTGSLATVGGAVLWQEPWVARFKQAGRDPVFQTVQVALARHGEHMRGAVKAWQALAVPGETALALCFDTAVQQGPAFAVRTALRVQRKRLAVGRRLSRFAGFCAAPFRRRTVPTGAHPVKHLRWVRHGEREWHVWAGEFDLWAAVTRRKRRILSRTTINSQVGAVKFWHPTRIVNRLGWDEYPHDQERQ